MQEFALVEQFVARFCGNTSTRVWQNDENALQNAVCRKLCVLFGKLQVKPCKLLQQNPTVMGKIAKTRLLRTTQLQNVHSFAPRVPLLSMCACKQQANNALTKTNFAKVLFAKHTIQRHVAPSNETETNVRKPHHGVA